MACSDFGSHRGCEEKKIFFTYKHFIGKVNLTFRIVSHYLTGKKTQIQLSTFHKQIITHSLSIFSFHVPFVIIHIFKIDPRHFCFKDFLLKVSSHAIIIAGCYFESVNSRLTSQCIRIQIFFKFDPNLNREFHLYLQILICRIFFIPQILVLSYTCGLEFSQLFYFLL